GEELGMTGRKPDEQIRTPMRWDASGPNAGFSTGQPWEPLSADPGTLNVADEAADSGSLLSWYRKLVALRAVDASLRLGDYAAAVSSNPHVLAAVRTLGDTTDIVLTNLSDAPTGG